MKTPAMCVYVPATLFIDMQLGKISSDEFRSRLLALPAEPYDPAKEPPRNCSSCGVEFHSYADITDHMIAGCELAAVDSDCKRENKR